MNNRKSGNLKIWENWTWKIEKSCPAVENDAKLRVLVYYGMDEIALRTFITFRSVDRLVLGMHTGMYYPGEPPVCMPISSTMIV